MSTLEQYIYDKNLWMVGDTPTVINPTGKFPVVANQQWKTLNDLITFVKDVNSSAIPGMIVSVVEDEQPDNNGVYIVEEISDGKNEGSVCKLANIDQIEEIKEQIEKLENDVNVTVTDSINTLKQNFDDTVKRLDGDIEESKQYISNAGADWKTESVGGISGGLKKDSDILSNKTICEMLDMLLYPTLQPVVEEQPSISITLPSTQKSLIEVGSKLLTEASMKKNIKINRGRVTYKNADDDYFYAGDVESEELTITGNKWDQIADDEKEYVIDYTVYFLPGPKLLDNKGGESTLKPYAGGHEHKDIKIHAVYPIYINTVNIGSMTSQSLKDYITGVTLTDINIPAETYDNKFEIHVPRGVKITSVKQFNTIANAYNLTINMVKVGTTTHNGVEYDRYVRTTDSGSRQGASKYQIIIKK